MPLEIIQVARQGEDAGEFRMLQLDDREIAWMADCSKPGHEIIFVAFKGDMAAVIHAPAQDIDTSKENIPLDGHQVNALLQLGENTKQEVSPGQTLRREYTDTSGNSTMLFVRNLGKNAIQPHAN